MNTAVMFSRQSDEWSTPDRFFAELDAEFQFSLDAAASAENAKCHVWYGGAIDSLALTSWCSVPSRIWLNPPYSRCREFIAKASEQAQMGHTVVCLVPARTDTRWFHEHIWQGKGVRPGVELRFVKGRLKFGNGKNGAPFPSVVVIFRPTEEQR